LIGACNARSPAASIVLTPVCVVAGLAQPSRQNWQGRA